MKSMNREQINEFLKDLDNTTKDIIYRTLWAEYVKEDLEGLLEEAYEDAREKSIDEATLVQAMKELDAVVDIVAERYVWDGDYDCNLSYWDNLSSLVDEELKKEG